MVRGLKIAKRSWQGASHHDGSTVALPKTGRQQNYAYGAPWRYQMLRRRIRVPVSIPRYHVRDVTLTS